jgi:RNA polymerase sigma-70 factor, ECF subfamily
VYDVRALPLPFAGPGPGRIVFFCRRREPWRPSNVQSCEQINVNRTAHEHEPTDGELVRQAQDGTPTAFTELVVRYQDRVFNTCYRMCHNQADALDLAQTTFLKALEALPSFQSRANFYTWLFRIAVNLAITHRRTAGRRGAAPLDETHLGQRSAAPHGDPDGGVAKPAEHRELQQRVAWALAQLDEEFRAAVVLKDIEDMDYSTIAEILDVPVGTVKSRIHRGRMMLRDLLHEEQLNVDRA